MAEGGARLVHSAPPPKSTAENEETSAVIRSSRTSSNEDNEEELDFPGFLPVAFFCLKQNTQPRKWCLKAITWPYPFFLNLVK